jgi:DegV family protein with EDD domain
MPNFIVATDSGCDLPYPLLKKRGIIPFPINYEMDGRMIADTMLHEDCKKFYDRMRAGAVPKTSQINIMQFVDFWRPLAQKGLPIVHICLGSGISGTYSNGAVAAGLLKKENPEAKIFLVDSTLASVGYGMLALKAADLRDEGKTPEECVGWLNAHKAEINTYYTTSDLTYLYRSGRVRRTGMIIAHALDIHPILNLDLAGHLIVQEKIRGKKKTVQRILAIIGGLVVDPQRQTLYVCHSDVPDEARELGDAIREKFGFRDVYYTYIGTTIGAHAGPGLMAAFFFGKPRTMKGWKG